MFKAIDISHWNNVQSFTSNAYDAVIIKATQGKKYVDKKMLDHAERALKAGKMIGFYHFYDLSASPEEQAQHFIDTVSHYLYKAILVLDWESDAVKLGVDYAKRFLDYVQKQTGVLPLIYMSQSVVKSHDWSKVKNNYGLWVARYNITLGDVKPWSTWALWQYTSTGVIDGIAGKVDISKVNMSESAWHRYAKGKGKVY